VDDSAATAVDGSTVALTATAKDAQGATVTSYKTPIKLASSVTTDTGVGTVTPSSGASAFTVALVGTGARTFTATSGSLTVTDALITTVTPGAAYKLAISTADGSTTPVKTDTSGSSPVVTVTVEDKEGAAVTGTTPITLSSTATGDAWTKATGTGTFVAASGSTPASYTYAAGDSGVATFDLKLGKTGKDTITIADSGLTSGTTSITTTTGTIDHLAVANTTTAPTANGKTCSATSTPGTAQCWINGEPVGIKVTAQDAAGNTVTGYTGTVKLTSIDNDTVTYPGTGTPVSYTFAAGDKGTKTFSKVQLTGCEDSSSAPCSDKITATDQTTSTIKGDTGTFYVLSGAVTKLTISAPGGYVAKTGIVAGTATTYTVVPENSYSQPVTSFTDKVHFNSSDEWADLPVPATQTYGYITGTPKTAETFSVTLHSVGTKTITVKDVAAKTKVTAGSVSINSTAGTADHLDIYTDDNAVNGSTIKVTVGVQDANGFPVTSGYTGSVKLTSAYTGGTDADVLPGAHALVNGKYVFTVTVTGCTDGTCADTLHATDTVTSTLKEKTAQVIHVTPGAVTKLDVVAGGSTAKVSGAAAAGIEVTGVSVTAQNVYGQTVADFTGTVHFTSTDDAADMPGNFTFTGGLADTTVCGSGSLPACTNGLATFNASSEATAPGQVILNTAGTKTIVVKDIRDYAIEGTAKVAVTAAS
jgi:hypothetical protein